MHRVGGHGATGGGTRVVALSSTPPTVEDDIHSPLPSSTTKKGSGPTDVRTTSARSLLATDRLGY